MLSEDSIWLAIQGLKALFKPLLFNYFWSWKSEEINFGCLTHTHKHTHTNTHMYNIHVHVHVPSHPYL